MEAWKMKKKDDKYKCVEEINKLYSKFKHIWSD